MTQDTDREIMQQALEALEASIALTMTKIELRNEAIAALREALAEQPVQEPYCYVYASRLAKHLWKKHYMKDAPQWKPFDDLIGVLTQIDNMTTGLTRLEQPVQDGWHTHDLYTDADKDRPDVICDRNGSVTLGLCKRCGRGESQLAEPCDKQPVQEPVAWISKNGVVYPIDAKDEVHPINELQPLYTTPPQRKPLTDEDTVALIKQCRDAFAEELGAWDIDPPIHHVQQGYDNCVNWLAAYGIKEKNT